MCEPAPPFRQSGLLTRRFLARAAGALALSPVCAFADPSSDKGPVAARNIEGRLSIQVRVDGKGPFGFIVDSGAERSVIASELAGALALPRGKSVLLRDIARSIPTETARVDELVTGRVRLRRAELPVLPRNWIGADGYLGLDVIDGHKLVLDFARGAMTLGDPRPQASQIRRPDEAVIKAGGAHGKLTAIDCSVDRVGVAAFLDTGAEVSVGNTRLLNSLASRGSFNAGGEMVRISGVTGGSLDCPLVKLSHLTLPELEFKDCAIAIADLQIFDIWGLSKRPALLIGMDLLRQFAEVTMDYGRKEYRFVMGEDGPARLRPGGSGSLGWT